MNPPKDRLRLIQEAPETDAAWLAGLFEGEGTILLRSARSGNSFISLRVAMTDQDVVQRVARAFGGTANYQNPPSIADKKRKPRWVWEASGVVADALMERMWPYLCERRRARYTELIGGSNVRAA